MDDADLRYLMGCVSVPLHTPGEWLPGSSLRALRDRLRDDHQDPERRAHPLAPARIGGRLLDDIVPSDTVAMPALMRGYLRLGARICGEPAVDDVFDVARFEPVQHLEQSLIDFNDDLVANAYTSFQDFRLWDTWFRVWSLGQILATFEINRAYAKYLDSHDPAVLEPLAETIRDSGLLSKDR